MNEALFLILFSSISISLCVGAIIALHIRVVKPERAAQNWAQQSKTNACLYVAGLIITQRGVSSPMIRTLQKMGSNVAIAADWAEVAYYGDHKTWEETAALLLKWGEEGKPLLKIK